MTLSIHDATIPGFVNMLRSLSRILDKGAAFAEAKKIDPTELLNARIAPDMFPLTRQVQIACDQAKGCAARLAGVEIPAHPDIETSFDELKARITATIAFVNGIDKARFEGAETRPVTMKVGPNEVTFPAPVFAFEFSAPNFYFHVSMVYAILRHNGVEIGKQDLLSGLAPYFGR